ncbi:transglutaminase family protein [Acaryochloris sp. IP29b_bin.137]|uniref:transglutaminase family protein n=1 Tax=Acaryochloris sp. IP29b_bin.137 TaxID=2969217 RepID=UPI00260CD7B6|nr:transglutaminase family protein [Acaryochloris sp. IP29b_bin.137]
MDFTIVHSTTYTYAQAVTLGPHLLRLRPRSTEEQQVRGFHLQISPEPVGLTHKLDAEGNNVARCWWSETPLATLEVTATSQVVTTCTNPFQFLLEPWATHFPIDYPNSLKTILYPYLNSDLDAVATQLAQELAIAVDSNIIDFLTQLNLRINQTCQYQARERGHPQPPWLTWQQKQGTCRDFVWLFMAACRGMGLATRFVSGYEAGDPSQAQTLHAWAEVYLPGAGWRGYDPTMGLVVCDRHVAAVASAWPQQTQPILGSLRGGISSPIPTHTVSVHSSATRHPLAEKRSTAIHNH